MRAKLSITALGLLTGAAHAQTMDVGIEVPRMSVAEYHRPYIAVWISHPDQKVAANLSVWYQLEAGPEGEGETWLKDMRQWWRRTGRTLDMPVDGVSTATRAPGQYTLTFTSDDPGLKGLKPGEYILHVEASREVGGRELISIPFEWSEDVSTEISETGETELGEIRLSLSPNPN
ncbi:MAG: hypothetical protein CMK09_01920 [Ponticaulis sp.]|nr:hypothetical protein [Ponticaulis sp.]|tara:strand:+ start:5227 stop:5751 length:525 start_codon:yes stop_codon:yes gene_type:complete